jgi:quinol monooxygenase YgiN
MIHVVAILTAKPGHRDALLAEVNANLAAVRAEEGCIAYGPALDAPFSQAKFGEDVIVILEQWATPEALAAHGKSAHMAAFGAKVRDIAAARPVVHILQPA